MDRRSIRPTVEVMNDFLARVDAFLAESEGAPTHNSEGNLIHPDPSARGAFHRWFSGSKIADEHGRPHVVYHGSVNDFTTFTAGESGFHFGHQDAAGLYGEPRPFYLKIHKPFHINRDLGDWKPEDLLRHLVSREYKGPGTGVSEEDEARTLRQVKQLRKKHKAALADEGAGHEERKARYAIAKPVRDLFEKHGYDGISYRNEGEGGTSYIAFHPEQIKSADRNSGAFSPLDPDTQR